MARETLTIPLRPTKVTGSAIDPVPVFPVSASNLDPVRVPMPTGAAIYDYALPVGCKGFDLSVINPVDQRRQRFDLSFNNFGGSLYHTYDQYYFYGLDTTVSFHLYFRSPGNLLTAQIMVLT